MRKSYADVLAEREKAAHIASSEDVSDTPRLAAGDTPKLVVVTPPKKRRVRPGVSARKRKEAKEAKEIIAEVVDDEIVIEVVLGENDSKELLGADAAQVEVSCFYGMGRRACSFKSFVFTSIKIQHYFCCDHPLVIFCPPHHPSSS